MKLTMKAAKGGIHTICSDFKREEGDWEKTLKSSHDLEYFDINGTFKTNQEVDNIIEILETLKKYLPDGTKV